MGSLQEQVRLYREYLEKSISSFSLDEKFEQLKAKVAIEYDRIVAEVKARRFKIPKESEETLVPSKFTIRMAPECERPTIEIPDETIKIKSRRMPESKIGSFFVANENFKPLPAKYQKRKGLKHD